MAAAGEFVGVDAGCLLLDRPIGGADQERLVPAGAVQVRGGVEIGLDRNPVAVRVGHVLAINAVGEGEGVVAVLGHGGLRSLRGANRSSSTVTAGGRVYRGRRPALTPNPGRCGRLR